MLEVQDLSSLHKYRTEIPNVVFRLGLDPCELCVYLFFKRVAGDDGSCYMTLKSICQQIKIGETKLKEAKKKLSESFQQLGGKSLIKIQIRYKKDGSRDTDLIQIEDIWEENFSAIKYFNKGKKEEGGGGSPKDPGVGRQMGYKEEHSLKKNDKNKESKENNDREHSDSQMKTSEATAGSSFSFSRSGDTVFFDPTTYRLANGEPLSQRMQRALAKYEGKAKQNLTANVLYYQKQASNPKVKIDNHERYLQKCISENYAGSQSNLLNNELYANLISEENKLFDIQILKSVVRVSRRGKEGYISLKKDLDPQKFGDELDAILNNWMD